MAMAEDDTTERADAFKNHSRLRYTEYIQTWLPVPGLAVTGYRSDLVPDNR
jgi:hypothetical protein